MTTTTTLTMTYLKADDEIGIFDHRQPPQALCSNGFSVLPDYPDDDCCVKWLENMCVGISGAAHKTTHLLPASPPLTTIVRIVRISAKTFVAQRSFG